MAVPEPQVAVVGGGIAGLSAAIHLAERGVSVRLFERTDLLGGKTKAWDILLPGDDGSIGPVTIEHAVHGFWSNYRNLRAFLNRIPDDQPTLERGVTGMSSHNLLVIDAERFRDARGRPVGRPGLREFENFVMVDEAAVGEMWGILDTRNVNPWLLPVAARLARTSLFLMGAPTSAMLTYLSLLMHDSDALLRVARRDRGLRVACAFLAHEPPAWLDDWTLEQAMDVAPVQERLRKYLTLVQSIATYWDPADTSAYHVARCLDFYGMRDPASMWWEAPQVGCHYDVIGRMATYAQMKGVDIRTMAGVDQVRPAANGATVILDEGAALNVRHAVVALDIPSAQWVLRTAHDDRLDRLRNSHVMVVRAFFKKRIRPFPNMAWWIGVLGSREAGCPFDFIFVASRFESSNSRAPGEVLEFHLPMADRFATRARPDIVDDVLDWAFRFYPELRAPGDPKDSLVHLTFNDVRNFSLSGRRSFVDAPGIESTLANVSLCGDWIQYRSPVVYMEKSFVTGVEAANRALRALSKPEHALLPMPEPSHIQEINQWVTDRLDAEMASPTPPYPPRCGLGVSR